MVAAVYTSDLTALVADSSATGNWAALGGGASGLNIETDYFIQGTRCVSKNAFASATKGMVEDTTNTLLTTGDLDAVYMWVTHTTPGSLDTKANGGITICLGSASNQLNRYFYAGSDTIDYGAPWICALVDPENATASSGSVAHSAVDTYGMEAKLIGGPTKGAPLGIDEIRQGRSYEVTEGDSGAPATFVAAAVKNDLLANRYGQLQGVPGISGSYTMQCRFAMGSSGTAAYFEDSNANISLNDLEFVDSGFTLFEVVNAGTTVKWTNITISAVGTNARGNFTVTASTLVDLTTCTFNDMGLFVLDSNTTVLGTVFRRTDQVTQTGATITNSTFDQSTSTPALVSDDIEIVTGCTFISDGTGHAVDIGNITSTQTLVWNNSLDDGAGTEWTGSTGTTVGVSGTANDAILVDVDGGFTLTLSVATGATIPTVRNVGTGTVTISAGEVTLTITTQDIDDSTLLENARVHVTAAAGGALSVGTVIIDKALTNASGIVTDTRSYASNQPVEGKVRLSSIAPFYKTAPVAGTVDSGSGLSLTIQMIKDQ